MAPAHFVPSLFLVFSSLAYGLPVATPSGAFGELLTLVAQSTKELELKPDLVIDFNPQDLSNPDDWKRKYFDLVVVIDKSPKKQTAKLYLQGKLLRTVKVSTGRERVEHADPNGEEHKATRDTVSETYTGYFTPTKLDIDYVSKTYEDSEMPFAVFFNEPEGEATHQAPPGTEKRLGHRASGGCVRMHERDARDIFWYTRFNGGPFTKEELANTRFEQEAKDWERQGWVEPESQPKIPKFDINGELQTNNKGEPVLHSGYKALFVVLNSSVRESKKVSHK